MGFCPSIVKQTNNNKIKPEEQRQKVTYPKLLIQWYVTEQEFEIMF